jgi:branched-chain amino acid transport system ATP-binding protein
VSEILLETVDLSKSFGALAAVRGISLGFRRGQVHAIIGPNGAGKTTLMNLLSGELRPSAGRVIFKGKDITSATPDRVSRLGVGRSYQKTNLFPGMTCFESAWIAAQSRLPSSMRFVRPASRLTDVGARAERALSRVGLTHLRDQVASAMSYGEQRQLEIALLLATEPELFLLDEPLAGMGPEEAQRVVGLIAELAREHTLILVEHDMDAVFQVADVLTVMVQGEVLITGSVAEVRASPAVQQAYLGQAEET